MENLYPSRTVIAQAGFIGAPEAQRPALYLTCSCEKAQMLTRQMTEKACVFHLAQQCLI